jgi:hypothetical protein
MTSQNVDFPPGTPCIASHCRTKNEEWIGKELGGSVSVLLGIQTRYILGGTEKHSEQLQSG